MRFDKRIAWFVENSKHLKSIEVDGNVFVTVENNSIVKRELYGFSDAGLCTYEATVYVRAVLKSGSVHRNLFT